MPGRSRWPTPSGHVERSSCAVRKSHDPGASDRAWHPLPQRNAHNPSDEQRTLMPKGWRAPRWRTIRILVLVLGLAAAGLAATGSAIPAATARADTSNSLGAAPLMGWSNWSYI